MTRTLSLRLGFVLVLLIGCGDDDAMRRCVTVSECESGLRCVDGVCVTEGSRDGGADASRDADSADGATDVGGDGAVDGGEVGEDVCDGLDGDGDGEVDEDCGCTPPAEQECYPGDPALVGAGACARGVQSCIADGEFGSFGPCTGAVLPGDEICGTDEDEDCDGEVDEDCGCSLGDDRGCYPHDGMAGVGICREGAETCVDVGDGVGMWGACTGSIGPRDEVCGPEDEDCDGSVDEGLCCGGDDANVLIVLDRTRSMHRLTNGERPGSVAIARESSKWAIAVNAIQSMVARYPTFRFGLELFPLDPGPVAGVERCRVLRGVVRELEVTNPRCQQGEEVIPPIALGSAAVAAFSTLSVTETRLCDSTPIGEGLVTARTILGGHRVADRPQYAVLLTDGRASRECEADATSLTRIDALRAEGVRTYVVGFDASGSGIDRAFLNNAACAGGTAASGCTSTGLGARASAPASGSLFYLARTELDTTLTAIRDDICAR